MWKALEYDQKSLDLTRMIIHVSSKVMFLRKSLRANTALKRFDSTVESMMQNHVGSISESLFAPRKCAFVWLFSALGKLDELVTIAQTLVCKIFSTHMSAMMLFKQHFARKLLAALQTCMRFKTEMYSHVHVERNSLVE